MEMIMNAIVEWLKEILVGGIVSNLSGMFDNVNQQVGDIVGQVSTTPQAWNGSIYSTCHAQIEKEEYPKQSPVLDTLVSL